MLFRYGIKKKYKKLYSSDTSYLLCIVHAYVVNDQTTLLYYVPRENNRFFLHILLIQILLFAGHYQLFCLNIQEFRYGSLNNVLNQIIITLSYAGMTQ